MNKFRAKRTQGFHSKKESKRYSELLLLEKAGMISKITCQRSFDLEVNGQLVCRYILDFEYYDTLKCEWVHEDVKGWKKGWREDLKLKRGCAYQLFEVKKNLMKAIYGIEITEV